MTTIDRRLGKLEAATGATLDLPLLILDQRGDIYTDETGKVYSPDELDAAGKSFRLIIVNHESMSGLVGVDLEFQD